MRTLSPCAGRALPPITGSIAACHSQLLLMQGFLSLLPHSMQLLGPFQEGRPEAIGRKELWVAAGGEHRVCGVKQSQALRLGVRAVVSRGLGQES